MAADFNAAWRDPALVSLRKEIATVDARIIDVLKRVDTGEAGATWHAAQTAIKHFDRARAHDDPVGMDTAISDLRRVVVEGTSDWAAWRVIIGELVDAKRKLIDTEQRRLQSAHDVLTADRAMLLLAEVVRILQRHITDRAILGAIARDMQGTLLMRQRDDGYTLAHGSPDAAD